MLAAKLQGKTKCEEIADCRIASVTNSVAVRTQTQTRAGPLFVASELNTHARAITMENGTKDSFARVPTMPQSGNRFQRLWYMLATSASRKQPSAASTNA